MLVLALTVLAASDGGAACERCQAFRSAREAFAHVLARQPLALAVGEYHETKSGPRVKSALKRFSEQLLPTLRDRAGALVVETWMTSGRCGEVEKKAQAAVAKTTDRPDSTEDEITAFMGQAHDLGFKNHILLLDCDEYRSMVDEQGELDPDKTLTLVKRKLVEKALEARDKGEGGEPGRLLLIYGGALHNDLYPAPEVSDWAFGPELAAATDGGFLELDLLVPELVPRDDELRHERWFTPALAQSAKGLVVLVEPRPNAFRLVFPKGSHRRR